MRGAALFLALAATLALAGCREGEKSPPPQLDPLTEITQACQKSGGRMVAAGKAQTCQHETRDAGKQCRRASDCQGECLARSGTCAPVEPLFGCHEILMSEGQRAMLCRD